MSKRTKEHCFILTKKLQTSYVCVSEVDETDLDESVTTGAETQSRKTMQ